MNRRESARRRLMMFDNGTITVSSQNLTVNWVVPNALHEKLHSLTAEKRDALIAGIQDLFGIFEFILSGAVALTFPMVGVANPEIVKQQLAKAEQRIREALGLHTTP